LLNRSPGAHAGLQQVQENARLFLPPCGQRKEIIGEITEREHRHAEEQSVDEEAQDQFAQIADQ